MNRLKLNTETASHIAEIITLNLQLGTMSESTLYTYGQHNLPNGIYIIEEFKLRIEIIRRDENRYWFRILGQI